MTPDELTALVQEKDVAKLVAALENLSDKERQALAKTAVQLRKLAKKECDSLLQDPLNLSSRDHRLREVSRLAHRSDLAVLATASWTEAQRISIPLRSWSDSCDNASFIYRLLKGRPPDWIARWVAKELASDFTDWGLVRRFIREGLCPKPDTDEYIQKMISTRAGLGWGREKTIVDILHDDPDLLKDEIWRIFEVEGPGVSLLQAMDATSQGGPGSWGHALKTLADEERIDRGRLLTASLEALRRGLQAKNTGWFCNFHELLAPTVDERKRRQKLYLDLLNSNHPNVAGFALDALAVLAREKLLAVSGLIESVTPVFNLRPKGQPMTALRLLKLAASQQPRNGKRIATIAIQALSHQSKEVQTAALALIESLPAAANEDTAAGIESRLDLVASSLQARARDFLIALRKPGQISNRPSSEAGQASEKLSLDVLLYEAKAVPLPWREWAGIDNVLKALSNGGSVPLVSFDPMQVPRLHGKTVLRSIQSLDELIEGLSATIEEVRDADSFELLLDGLSRLCDQRPDDFPARVAPLLHRIEKLVKDPHRPFWWGYMRGGMMNLIRTWCESDWKPLEVGYEDKLRPIGFLVYRLQELEMRVHRRRAAPLLACPTHQGGWIDPPVLVERLLQWRAAGLQPSRHDFIQALLRLAPDHRNDALEQARNLNEPYAHALRYALGGPLEGESTDLPLLIAAGRSRNPRGVLPELIDWGALSGPDVTHPAGYDWQIKEISYPPQWQVMQPSLSLMIEASPAWEPKKATPDHPTLNIHRKGKAETYPPYLEHNEMYVENIRWIMTIWPHNLDAHFAVGAKQISQRLDGHASNWYPNGAYLEPLFDPDTPFTEMAQLLLAVSLISRDADVRGLAIDALSQIITDGRCTGPEFGHLVGRLMATGFVRRNRLAVTLDAVAKTSLWHTHVCGQIVQSALILAPFVVDLHFLLSVLQEWLSELQEPLCKEVTPVLATMKSGGKSAKLIKALLSRTGELHESRQKSAFAIALQGRLNRARRWLA